jgi:hypothetical protein
MVPVCVEGCANWNIHVQGKENGSRIPNGIGTNNIIMPSGSVEEKFYLKEVVIYLLIIWIIEGIPESFVSSVRVVDIEVMGIRPNFH